MEERGVGGGGLKMAAYGVRCRHASDRNFDVFVGVQHGSCAR